MKQTNIAQTEQKAQEDAYEVCRDLDGTPLTHYVLAERLVQVEYHRIMQDTTSGPSETLIYILEGGYRGFHNQSPAELYSEWRECGELWHQLYRQGELPWDIYSEDPILARNT